MQPLQPIAPIPQRPTMDEQHQTFNTLTALAQKLGMGGLLVILAGVAEDQANEAEDQGRMVRSDRLYRVSSELDSLAAYLSGD